MAGKRGRPAKTDCPQNSRQLLIDAAVFLIKNKGADYVTVRSVCEEANLSIGTFYHYFRDKDDLMMYFISELSFPNCELTTGMFDVTGRIIELYMKLIDRYMELGIDFMKSFYSTNNRSLSAYMGESDGKFFDGTVMSRCEKELWAAYDMGYVKAGTDIHRVCMDICTIVKGCIFEWCLNDGEMNVEETLRRIVDRYLDDYLVKPAQ